MTKASVILTYSQQRPIIPSHFTLKHTERDLYDVKCASYLHSPLTTEHIFPGGTVSVHLETEECKRNSISVSNFSV